MRTPTSQQWSLTIERGLARDLMLSVGYVGSQSYHTPFLVNANAIYPIVCQDPQRSEEHTSELQSPCNLVCRLLLEKKKQRCVCPPPSPDIPPCSPPLASPGSRSAARGTCSSRPPPSASPPSYS